MDPVSLMSRSVTIVRIVSPETYDAPASETSETVCGEVQQIRRDDNQALDNDQDQTWNLFLPPGTDIRSDDLVDVSGIDKRFVVRGDPWPARHPRSGEVTHIEATIRSAG